LKDAVFNLSAVALMPFALSNRPLLLRSLLNDRLHEPYRAPLVPGFYAVKKAALKKGAYGVILSGAGPTMLSFAPKEKSDVVARAMKKTFEKFGVSSETMILEVDRLGAIVK
jgi:homoserine kinase